MSQYIKHPQQVSSQRTCDFTALISKGSADATDSPARACAALSREIARADQSTEMVTMSLEFVDCLHGVSQETAESRQVQQNPIYVPATVYPRHVTL
jgi:hypothetical protein